MLMDWQKNYKLNPKIKTFYINKKNIGPPLSTDIFSRMSYEYNEK